MNEQVSNSVKPKTVKEAFNEYLRLLQEENRRGYMLSVKQVYNSLIKYNKHLNIHFTDIDVAWLKKYETWLRNNGLAEIPSAYDSEHCAPSIIMPYKKIW